MQASGAELKLDPAPSNQNLERPDILIASGWTAKARVPLGHRGEEGRPAALYL